MKRVKEYKWIVILFFLTVINEVFSELFNLAIFNYISLLLLLSLIVHLSFLFIRKINAPKTIKKKSVIKASIKKL